MMIKVIAVGQLDTNCMIISDPSSGDACIVDPGDEPEKISAWIDLNGLRPVYIIFTHAHYDHVCAARELKERYHSAIVMHEDEKATYAATKLLCMSWGYDDEDFPIPDVFVREDDIISIGSLSFRVIHTPGHTPGSICLLGDGVLLTGDTLFRGSAGRTDLPGGSAEHLCQSLKKLSRLPPATRVLCGHDGESSLGIEITTNPFMAFS